MSTSKYRLVYFDVRALAEPIRWIFHYTGTAFEDERLPWDLPLWFTQNKKKFESSGGQLPVLYEEGKPELGESQAISRYLAKKFGLDGNNAWEDAQLDEIISLVYDLFIAWRTCMFERDPERKVQSRAMIDTKFKLYYAKFNKTLEASGGPYILGDKLTHADFWLANFISIWDEPMKGPPPVLLPGMPTPSQSDVYLDFTKEYPALRKHKEMVNAIPQIKDWIQIRNQTIA